MRSIRAFLCILNLKDATQVTRKFENLRLVCYKPIQEELGIEAMQKEINKNFIILIMIF